ncbi:hypothetical protein M0802_005248 [Mischocyttarus mexicanus]|nr:hypothetical protein M0802_005248 [Mischocyttarus mexicanus]
MHAGMRSAFVDVSVLPRRQRKSLDYKNSVLSQKRGEVRGEEEDIKEEEEEERGGGGGGDGGGGGGGGGCGGAGGRGGERIKKKERRGFVSGRDRRGIGRIRNTDKLKKKDNKRREIRKV